MFLSIYVPIIKCNVPDLPGIEGSINDKEWCSHGRDNVLREETLQNKIKKALVNIVPCVYAKDNARAVNDDN